MKRNFMRFVTVPAFVAALAATTSITPFAEAAAGQGKTRESVSPMRVFGTTEVVPNSGSQLIRTKDGVYMTLHTSGLVPGTVATVWWVFFNNPGACGTTPCTTADLGNEDVQASVLIAAGRLVGTDGTADFGSFRAVGDATGAIQGSGLTNPMRAEIHLAVRSHGPAMLDDPEALRMQLGTFNGGCPPNTCGNVQASIHEP
jgi:hypothetical protein